MIKVVLYQDGEIIQEMEGEFTWGSVSMNDEESRAFVLGTTDATELPINMAKTCVSLLLELFKTERGTPGESLIRKVFLLAIESAFENKPDKAEILADKEEAVG